MSDAPPAEFVVTREYRRFAEFCEACRRYRYIGLCYGPPGVGKSLSAHRYARWEPVSAYQLYPRSSTAKWSQVRDCHVVCYTPPVMNNPRQLEAEIRRQRLRLLQIRRDEGREQEETRLAELRQAEEEWQQRLLREVNWLSEAAVAQATALRPDYGGQAREYGLRRQTIPDPTDLILVDEADRLKMAGLEQMRAIFDQGGIGLVLIGMPGLEKRRSRYAQFSSRVGFVHEFRPLTGAAVRELLQQGWAPPGVSLPSEGVTDEAAIAAIIRITGGNFRLLHRLLTQTERLLEINALSAVTRPVIEAARESLVIGSG
jgi:DNA transposition AAA+ family ATPase